MVVVDSSLRIITFRSWNKTTSKMHYNENMELLNQHQDDLIFLEFTGLHDMNDSPIYEHDIVAIGETKGVVKYGQFALDSDHHYWTMGWFIECSDIDDAGEPYLYKTGLLSKNNNGGYEPVCNIRVVGNIYQ